MDRVQMGLLSGLELVLISTFLGLLFLLSTRARRVRNGLSPLLLALVVVLLFAVFSLSEFVVALLKLGLLLILVVAVLITSLAYTVVQR